MQSTAGSIRNEFLDLDRGELILKLKIFDCLMERLFASNLN